MSHRNASKSRCDIKWNRIFVDGAFDVRVPDPAGHHEVHFATEQLLKCFLKSEELTEPRKTRCIGKKLHEKIHVTFLRIEVISARSAAEESQRLDVVFQTQAPDLLQMSLNLLR